jgi:signal transduction histidine kinase
VRVEHAGHGYGPPTGPGGGETDGVVVTSGPDLRADTMMIIPVVAAGTVLATLIIGCCRGRGTADDLERAAAFANEAALAIELCRVERDRARLAVFEDRDRIARELHDLVIQRLFGTGLHLQALSRFVDESVGARLAAGIVELDQTIDEIRRTILLLGPPVA